MCVRDQAPVVNLDALVPVRMVADHDVGTPIDGLMPDAYGIVRRGHASIRHRLALVLLAPVKLHDHDVGQLARTLDTGLQGALVDGAPDPVEPDESELHAPDIDDGHRPQA